MSFSSFFLHASDEEKIRVFTEADNLANQDQRRIMKSKCCNVLCNVLVGIMNTRIVTCSQCGQEVFDDTPPIDGEIVADGKAQVLLADDEYKLLYPEFDEDERGNTAEDREILEEMKKRHDVSGTESVRNVSIDTKCNEWYDSYGMEIADGADPRGVIQRLLVEHERRMKGVSLCYACGEDCDENEVFRQGHIQGQIDAYTDIFEHASGGGDFRRLCVQRAEKLKKSLGE